MKKNSMDFSQLIIGIDVSKDDLHICISGLDAVKGMNIIRQLLLKTLLQVTMLCEIVC